MATPPNDDEGGLAAGTPTERVGDDVTVGAPADQPAGTRGGPATWVTGAIVVGVLALLVLVMALVVD